MNVEKVFWSDPYLTTLTAQITSIDENVVTVDKTIAFAVSGGQASDDGTINGYDILKAEKVGRQILYTIASPHTLAVGQNVVIKIDWDKRYKLMRLHFAAEIMLELVYQRLGKPEKIGANITDQKARLDFFWESNIASEFPLLLAEANRIISSDLPIISAFENEELELRYWEVKEFAKVPCGGTHLRSTGEVGGIRLKRDNIGKGKERIEIYLEENA